MTFEELLEKLNGNYSLFFPNVEVKKHGGNPFNVMLILLIF
ncbi:hypothetical protein AAHB53_05050 [Niallia circulans]